MRPHDSLDRAVPLVSSHDGTAGAGARTGSSAAITSSSALTAIGATKANASTAMKAEKTVRKR